MPALQRGGLDRLATERARLDVGGCDGRVDRGRGGDRCWSGGRLQVDDYAAFGALGGLHRSHRLGDLQGGSALANDPLDFHGWPASRKDYEVKEGRLCRRLSRIFF